jgi:hypothetical protein
LRGTDTVRSLAGDETQDFGFCDAAQHLL